MICSGEVCQNIFGIAFFIEHLYKQPYEPFYKKAAHKNFAILKETMQFYFYLSKQKILSQLNRRTW